MKPKLYQYEACPFCHKVKSILAYKGIDYETHEVHPLKKKEIEFSKDYRAVPIYIDSQGKQVNDSTPIMRWIDQEFPDRRVFKEDPGDIETENKWLAWSEGFVKGLPAVIYDSFPNSLRAFDYITKVAGFNWFEKRMIKYSGAFVMTLVAKKIKKREQMDRPDQFVRQKCREWVEGLEGRNFMGGTEPGAADLAVFGITRSVIGLPAGNQLRNDKDFNAWMIRVQETMKSAAIQA